MPITLREPRADDAQALYDLLARNRTYFGTGEPLRTEAYYTPGRQRTIIEEAGTTRAAGTSEMFLIESDGLLVGRANLNAIIRGAFQSASVSYVVDRAHTGRGIATQALQLLINEAFSRVNLHRLQAEVLPANHASKRVLARCGFAHYGTAPDYLCIQGTWQTHDLLQLINHGYDANT